MNRVVAGVRLTLLAAALVVSLSASASAQDHPGKAVYEKWCAGCHGSDGKGEGAAAAFMLPRPRNFAQAQYQIRTTRSGSLPSDEDILRVIDEGMPGTAMPGWKKALSARDRQNLVAYLKTFSRFFESDKPDVLDLGRAAGGGQDVIEQGREAYANLECWKCHGRAGRGDGASASTQEDDNKFPIRPADLTQPWLFNGGGTPEDIYRRLRTGMDGTPMPSLTDALEGGVVTDAQLWAIAHYVRSLAPDDPVVREVIEARRVATLPSSPDDSLWNEIDRFWIPLVGQIIVKPRWFSPAVTGLWVQAVHDGSRLSMRVSWNDRSNSPDPAWAEWRARTVDVMEPKEGDPPVADAPDALAVWFPRRAAAGMERPYFFMGSARDPVYLWQWQSRGETAEVLGRGPGVVERLPSGNGLAVQSVFEQGQWRVVFSRPLVPMDSANATALTTGQPIPVAFFARDGDNAEDGTRGSLSTWYFLYLGEPTNNSVYLTPLVATLLTAGLGLLVVRRAQKRERDSNRTGRAEP